MTIIHYNTPNLVKQCKQDGWTTSDGSTFKTEHIARYYECTHRKCKSCNNDTPKIYSLCEMCRESNDITKYNSYSGIQWDNIIPIYSESHDEYFFDQQELLDYIDENNVTIDKLRLVICKPTHLSQIDEDYWMDDLPEDGELSPNLKLALAQLNTIIQSEPPSAWIPSNIMAII